MAVVCPFVGHVECGADRTSVGIDASLLKQVDVQLLVQVVDRVVERQQDNLGYLLDGHFPGNVLSTAEAVGQEAHVLAALGGGLVGRRGGIDGLGTDGREAVDVNKLLSLGHNRVGGLQSGTNTSRGSLENIDGDCGNLWFPSQTYGGWVPRLAVTVDEVSAGWYWLLFPPRFRVLVLVGV